MNRTSRSPVFLRSISIRTRLLFIMIALTVISVAIAGGIAAWLGRRDGIARVEESLSAIASLKEVQLKSWQTSLENALAAEIERDAKTQLLTSLLSSEPATSLFEAIARNQLYIFNNAIASEGSFDEISLLNRQGVVILSTRPEQEGRAQGSIEFFRKGIESPYVSSPAYDISLGYLTIVVAQPVVSDQGETLGVLIGRANLKGLDEIMLERTGLGQTGEMYLVDRGLLLVTPARSQDTIPGESYIRTQGAEDSALNGQNGTGEYLNYQGLPVIGAYRYISGLGIGLIAEQQQSEALATVRATTISTIGAAIGAALLAILAALLASTNLSQPLVELTETARRIAGGNLDLRVKTGRGDEIGQLATAFNQMTAQLKETLEGLEQRVADRTRALELSADVSRGLSTILDPSQLVREVVEQIQGAFDYYHVHIYLFDETREHLVMAGGTGEAGRIMLERGHRLSAGKGLVGRATETGTVVLVPDTSQDPNWLPNPLLPETKSEIAVPILAGDQILGALDVQQNVIGGFGQQDTYMLSVIANQVAIALRNARLYAEAQQQVEQDAVIGDIIQQIQSTNSIEDALKVALRELGRTLGVPRSSVKIRLGQGGNGREEEVDVQPGVE